MINWLMTLSPVWRQRLIGCAIGAPIGILLGLFTAWLSLRTP